MSGHPCFTCGACCAAFRVDFHCSELDSEGGFVPAELAERYGVDMVRLRGTDYAQPRCVALIGQVGVDARCGIYSERPSPCREFAPLAEIGLFAEACNRARAQHGLSILLVGAQ